VYRIDEEKLAHLGLVNENELYFKVIILRYSGSLPKPVHKENNTY
jgi:hypothetical protein